MTYRSRNEKKDISEIDVTGTGNRQKGDKAHVPNVILKEWRMSQFLPMALVARTGIKDSYCARLSSLLS